MSGAGADLFEILQEERNALACIGATLTWLGDPYLIPLAHIDARTREAEYVRRWKSGQGESEEEEADRIHQRNVRRMKKRALRGQLPQSE